MVVGLVMSLFFGLGVKSWLLRMSYLYFIRLSLLIVVLMFIIVMRVERSDFFFSSWEYVMGWL